MSLDTRTAEERKNQEPAATAPGAPPKSSPVRTGRRRRYLRTPVVPQMEEQDCGAACLAIVLGAFGRRTTLHEASRSCGVSRDGVSAAAVARAAGRYGLVARGRRVVRGDDRLLGLDAVPVPSMVLVTGPHFAVFEGIKRGRVRVNDPSLGSHSATPAEFWDSFAGIAVGFEPGPDFERGGARFPFLRGLLARVRPYGFALLVAVLVAVLLTVPAMAAAFLLRAYLTSVTLGGTGAWALPLVLATGGSAAAVLLGTWLQQSVVNRVLASMAARTSTGFLWRMLRLPGSFFHRRQLGGLVTRVQINDGLSALLSYRAAGAAASAATAAAHLAALIWLQPRLALVPVVVAVIDVAALKLADRRRGGMLHQLHSEQHKRDGVAFAGISAIETLKAEGAEDSFFRSWSGWQARAMDTAQNVATAVLVPLSLPTALTTAGTAAVVVAGTALLIGGSVTVGTLLAFLLLLNGFLLPVTQLVGTGSELTMARAQSALLDDVELSEPDPYLTAVLDPVDGSAGPVALSGLLELRDVSFGYDPNRPATLDGISLTVRPGEWVAVVGSSGSGKSTLARLAAGVLRPWTGDVLLDGVPRESLPRAVVTSQVAYVEQRLRLFEGTIRDNLTLWNPAADETALHRALADAEAADLVRGRGGLDAGRIEEDARNLSGGERQRLELARALALDPPLLVLDEATSALDARTEALVNTHLRRRGTGCLVLAHRLSTVRSADRVVVLEGGRIVQQGTPAELAAVPGRYRTLLSEAGGQDSTDATAPVAPTPNRPVQEQS
ncbi:ATP-binding cassette domain-containing protein [Streptomyces sp. RKAG293]|uniref:ATP-binding cassette domain-containing protein n=1 Tax=Streptomyces sp. RKAG293 TaxID=2893403 RepID=UPI0020338B25|nr:ATP-binding cassette domain-containing protein [Streptomyces sp. RKAG293]MCM2423105.1 ATP-binding cassette domain-containing protein [Streptomyces sp. RKAG293]